MAIQPKHNRLLWRDKTLPHMYLPRHELESINLDFNVDIIIILIIVIIVITIGRSTPYLLGL